jgi:hypothetical protein
VALRWCCDGGVTVILQWCYSGVTVVSPEVHPTFAWGGHPSGRTPSPSQHNDPNKMMKFKLWSTPSLSQYSDPENVIECSSGVTMLLHWSYTVTITA